MRLTRILFLSKSVRDDLLEMQKKRNKTISISEFLVWLYKERNFSLLDGLRNFQENQRNEAINAVNRFFENDLYKLGPDLHAATYTLKLGGKCRLHGSPRWLSLNDNNIKDVLPSERIQNFSVEGLDLSKTVIKADGISNIERCSNLKTLKLNDCVFNDDWLLSRISHTFCDSLEYLDISNCKNITDNGLLTLGYLKNLTKLKIENLNEAKNKEFISILLEENQPSLVIEGVDHLSEKTLETIEKEISIQDEELRKIIETNKIKN